MSGCFPLLTAFVLASTCASSVPIPVDVGRDAAVTGVDRDGASEPDAGGEDGAVEPADWRWPPCVEGPVPDSDGPQVDCSPPIDLPPDTHPVARERAEDFDALERAYCEELNRFLRTLEPAAAERLISAIIGLGLVPGRLIIDASQWGYIGLMTPLACEDLGVVGDSGLIAHAPVERHRALLGIADPRITVFVRNVRPGRSWDEVFVLELIDGLPIFNGSHEAELIVQMGHVREVHARFVPGDAVLSLVPSLSSADAIRAARAAEPGVGSAPVATLGIYGFSGRPARATLAWRVRGERSVVFVDAASGDVLP